jgi:hypothetical protein
MNPGAVSVISMPDLVRMLRAGQSSQQSSHPSYHHLGPPNMVDDPYFDPAFTAQNAVRKIQGDMAPSGHKPYLIGAPNMVDDPYFDPAFSGQNAIRNIRANMARAQQVRDTFIQTGPSLSNWS